MHTNRFIILLFITSVLSIHCFSQDTSYAIKIDSLWVHSYNTKLLASKRETLGKAKIEYSYYRNSKTIRNIVVLDKASEKNLLFFFIEDKLVMLSPSGQEPYFVLNDKVVSAKEAKHTSKQLEIFIAKAYAFLERGYRKIKGVSK